jgi:hypothetical protein
MMGFLNQACLCEGGSMSGRSGKNIWTPMNAPLSHAPTVGAIDVCGATECKGAALEHGWTYV